MRYDKGKKKEKAVGVTVTWTQPNTGKTSMDFPNHDSAYDFWLCLNDKCCPKLSFTKGV